MGQTIGSAAAFVARRNGDYVVALMLENEPDLKRRCELVENIFRDAVSRYDDESALRYLGYVNTTIEDALMQTFIGPFERMTEEQKRAYDDVKLAMRKSLALVHGIRLYGLLPGRSPTDQASPMPKTRGHLLYSILNEWGSMTEAQEEQAFLDFLTSVFATGYGDDLTLFSRLLRDSIVTLTVKGKLERLAGAYRAALPMKYNSDCPWGRTELLRVLRIAWVRERDEASFANDLDLIMPVLHASPGAAALMANIANEVAALDAEARELVEYAKPWKDRADKPVIQYLQGLTGPIGLKVRIHGRDDEDRVVIFASIAARVRTWLTQHPNRRVELYGYSTSFVTATDTRVLWQLTELLES